MKTKFLIISILLVVFMHLKAMVVSQGIIPEIDKGSALIVGTHHRAPIDQATKDADALVKSFQSFVAGAYIIVEINEDMLTNSNKDSKVLMGDALIGNLALGLVRLRDACETKNVLIAADARSSMSFEFKFIFDAILQMGDKCVQSYAQGKSSQTDLSIATELKKLERQIAAFNSTFSLKDYFKQLDTHYERMKAIKQKYLPGNPELAKMLAGYEDAYRKIKDLFRAAKPDDKAAVAVVKLFEGSATVTKLTKRAVQIHQLFVMEADSNYATFIFLQKLCDHAALGRNVVMITGDLHAKRLKQIFKSTSKEVLYDRTIVQHGEAGVTIKGDPRAAFNELLSTAKIFTEHNNFSTLVRYYFQTHCAKCNSTKDLKRCARCKNVVYCSDRCRQDDWALHTKFCKE